MDWVRVAALACVALAACPASEGGSDDGDLPPLPGAEVGDPCNSAAFPCQSSLDALQCIEGRWEQVACADVCIERHDAYVDGVCTTNKCECELANPNGCDPLERACVDADVIRLCSDAQVSTEVACAQLCSEAGFTGTAGCSQPLFSQAVCLCE